MEIHTTSVAEILNDPAAFAEEYVGMRRGLLGADDDEWCAGMIGGHFMFGTVALPEPDEPVICFVADPVRNKITSSPCILQHVAGKTWMNCNGGETFEIPDTNTVIVLGGLSPKCTKLIVHGEGDKQ